MEVYRKFYVMITSPSDVENEVEGIKKHLNKWNDDNSRIRKIFLEALDWKSDTYPSIEPKGPQDTINKQILAVADILVGVFWTRMGTPTDNYPSGSAEEIGIHTAANKPAMLYFSDNSINPSKIDADQHKKLENFKNEYKSKGLVYEYSSLDDFDAKFPKQFNLLINRHEYFNRHLPNLNPGIAESDRIDDLFQQVFAITNKNTINTIETIVDNKYRTCINLINQSNCKTGKKPENERRSRLLKHILINVCNIIKDDIDICIKERSKLNKPSIQNRSVAGGIIIYHLSEINIIQLCPDCRDCEHQCFAKINTYAAIASGFEYAGIQNSDISPDIREKILTFDSTKNTDKESLGIFLHDIKCAVRKDGV